MFEYTVSDKEDEFFKNQQHISPREKSRKFLNTNR